MERHFKVLIVGGGIAGYSVLVRLLEAGVHTQLYDLPENNTSSRKAAGLVNPFIIKRYSLSWKGAEAFGKALNFYQELQTRTGIGFLELSPIYRWLPHEAVWKEWLKMLEEKPHLSAYMGLPEPVSAKALRGGWRALVPQSFRVRTESLFEALEKWCEGCVRKERFVHEHLKFFKNQWIYEDTAWDAVIFCEGTSVVNNPFFRQPFLRPCKGQWLITHNPGVEAGYLGAFFLLPEPENRLLVGSTYEHYYTSEGPDAPGRHQLAHGYRKMTGLEPVILDQVAGIRPVSADRRPVIGPHPQYAGLFLMNGLGSRGFLLAPYLAELLVKYLIGEENLPREILYSRFFKYV